MTKINKTLAPRCKSILGMIVAGMLLFGGATQAQNMKQKITLTVKKQTKVEISLAANAYATKIQFQALETLVAWSDTIGIKQRLITISPSDAGTIEIYGDVTTLAIERNNHNILEIDASTNTALTKIVCRDDSLKSLNITNCTALTYLDCSKTKISSLDLSKHTALTELSCYGNKMSSLDVSKNTALIELRCYDNQLTSLDVSNNPDLCVLAAYGNNFSTEGFDSLMCSLPMRTPEKKGYFNPIYSTSGSSTEKDNFAKSNVTNAKAKNWEVRDVDNYEVLTTTGTYSCVQVNSDRYITLTVTKDNLISIRLATDSANTPVRIVSGDKIYDFTTTSTSLTKSEKYLTGADTMTIYGDVKAFYCNDNETKVTGIDISNNTALCTLSCYRNQLTSLDVSKNTALTDLNCDNSQLTSLDVSKNTALCTLKCSFNKLTSLDVSACTSLVELYCVTNSLTSLNVSGCTSLTTLSFYNNSLTSLDVSTCTSLKNLDCSTNSFTSLNVSGCTSLETVHCSENQLTTLNIRGCTNLQSLTCYSNLFTIAGYDSLMCLLPDRSANSGSFYPLINPNDTNYSVFAASNATNATAKNWKVVYPYESTALETTGNFNCNGLSIEEGEDAMGIALYPNPAKTMLNIENAIGNVQIFDITGRMLINVENKETNLLQINVSNLSKGMYFVKVGNYITKFVKE